VDIPIEIVIRGEVGDRAASYARTKIGRVGKFVRAPILFARVTLQVEPNPARERGRRARV
jgi:hypothetical protein